MRKEIIFNDTDTETRIAILEEGRLVELHVETPEKEHYVGNIYLAKIAKVMPGIRAAFIDVGLQQDAFLHFSDVGSTSSDYTHLLDEEDEVDIMDDDEEENETNASSQSNQQQNSQRRQRNNSASEPLAEVEPYEQLVRGDSILVQVTKEPTGNKGVRVTSEISLPGRFLVLLPFRKTIGVSKRMTNFREKRRLRFLVRSILPRNENLGVIIRTVAMEQDEEILRQDLKSLIDNWHEIEKEIKEGTPPKLVYKDVESTHGVLRDLLTPDVERIVCDSKNTFREVRAYLQSNQPALLEKVEPYKGREPIFDVFGIEKELTFAMQKKVPLRSGGSIVIEPTEAMVVCDVNTGRFAKKQDQELNSLQTNLEAAREIARQLRLRDLGGICVIDFIDLQDERNQKRVLDELRKELRKDRAKTTVLPMSEFGICEMTRQRIRQSVLHSFSEPCPLCQGVGIVISKATVSNNIERWIRRYKADNRGFKRFILEVNPVVSEFLHHGLPSRVLQMMLKYRVHIKVEPTEKLAQHDFHILLTKNRENITSKYDNN
ncbi:MAG: Rne/Rng family ribonuclease [Ignavibacteria bacterium]|nr:Rne/Rng family ribonuclease [Ignavibacteria bacterium]